MSSNTADPYSTSHIILVLWFRGPAVSGGLAAAETCIASLRLTTAGAFCNTAAITSKNHIKACPVDRLHIRRITSQTASIKKSLGSTCRDLRMGHQQRGQSCLCITYSERFLQWKVTVRSMYHLFITFIPLEGQPIQFN